MRTKYYIRKFSERNGEQSQSLSSLPTQSNTGDEGGLDLGQLIAAVRRRTLVVVGVTITVTAAALGLAKASTPKYEGKFELLAEPLTVENKLLSSLPHNLSDSKDDNQEAKGIDPTTLKVLQSPKLMNPITKEVEERYPGSKPLNLELKPIDNTNILQVSYQDTNPNKVQLVLNVVARAYLTYSLENQQTDIQQGIQFVEGQLPILQDRVDTLQQKLQQFRRKYDIIDLAGQGQRLSEQLSQIVQRRQDTHAQLVRTKALYVALQNQLGIQPNQAVAASALSEDARYQRLLNDLQEVETNIAAKSVIYNQDSPIIQRLRIQEQQLMPLVQAEAQRVLGNTLSSEILNPRSLAAQNSIRFQQTQQFLDAARQIQVLEAQDAALSQAENLSRQQVKQFPLIEGQNDDLERQLKIAVENLNQFLSKRAALRLDAAQQQKPWQLLTPPTQPERSAANVKRSAVLGVAFGLLLGIGAALLVDKFSNVFYDLAEVKDSTRLLVLGEIPFEPEINQSSLSQRRTGMTGIVHWSSLNLRLGRGRNRPQQSNISKFWESFRSLYMNIRFFRFDVPITSLAIISAGSEDGRSTIAIHLAQTAAAMGQRVLLVDADLRQPKLHRILELPNQTGLSNLIAEDLDFNEIIERSPNSSSSEATLRRRGESLAEGNFFVLTAGQIPPNPASLLASQKMKSLTEQFQSAFDLVVYDTPPLLGLADSGLLTAHTDASILVVGLGKTDRSALGKVLDGFRFSSTPILGVVANRTR